MTPIMFFILVAFLGTLAMLLAGGISMVRGGKFDMDHSLELMEGRVLLQALTLGLIIIAVFAWS